MTRRATESATGLRGLPAAQPPRAGVQAWIRGALFDHLPVKALAVLLTLTVFLLVGSDEDREIPARIGVSYVLPEGKVLAPDSERIDEVLVTIKGPWRRIKRFDEREIDRITLDLSRGVAGEVPISPDAVHLPRGLVTGLVYLFVILLLILIPIILILRCDHAPGALSKLFRQNTDRYRQHADFVG